MKPERATYVRRIYRTVLCGKRIFRNVSFDVVVLLPSLVRTVSIRCAWLSVSRLVVLAGCALHG